MSPHRRVLSFLFWSMVIYGLLIVPPHGLMTLYRAGFRTVGNVLFQSVGDGGSARLEKYAETRRNQDTTLRLTNRRAAARGSVEFRANLLGYRPTAFLIALILAAPVPWRRKGWALVWGIPLVSLFVAVRLWLKIVDVSMTHDALALYSLTPFMERVTHTTILVFVKDATVGYIAPAVIWMLVTFRREDWARMVAGEEQGQEEKAPRDRTDG